MSEKVIMPKTGFCVRKSYEGQKDFDEFYEDKVIKQVAKKVGEGEDDFIIEDKVIVTKRPIKEVIEAQFCDAGLDAYLEPYIKTGESLPDPSALLNAPVQDYTNFPENLAEAANLGVNAKALYQKLDPRLVAGRSLEQFLAEITPEKINEFYTSLNKKVEEPKKVEEQPKKEGN